MSHITKSRIEELRKFHLNADQSEWSSVHIFAGEEVILGCVDGQNHIATARDPYDSQSICATHNSSKSLLDLAEWALEAKEVLEKIENEWRSFGGTSGLASSHLAKFKELK